MKYNLKIGKEILNFNLAESGEIFNIEFNEKKYNAELIKIDSNLYSMILDGQTCTVAIKKEGKSIEIFYKGDLFSFEIPSARDKSSLENASGVDKISAPMPGRVVKVLKKVGKNENKLNKQKNKSMKSVDLEKFKKQCKDLGFKPKTEKFGECVLRLLEAMN